MPPRKNQFHVVSLIALFALVASAFFLSACTPPTQLLSVLFEGVPPPGKEASAEPVGRQPRRPPYKPPAPLEVKPVVVEEPPPKPDWAALFQKLPKVADGSVDWMRALDEKLIAPKAGIDPKSDDQPAIDLTLELVRQGQPAFKATFPHKAHTQWFACANCHPAIFQMKRGANPITMEKIFTGEFCGRCHGKVAFALTGCPRCHLAMPK